jgi:hypothetical protein
MLPHLTRLGVAPRDLRPEDMIGHHDMNAILRRAAGIQPDELMLAYQAYQANPRLWQALRMLDRGEHRASAALVLQRPDLDTSDKAYAWDVLYHGMETEPLDEASYAAIAALLSTSRDPEPAVRAAAALALLELDDADSAAIAGSLLVANGDAFATLVNQIR